MPYFQNHKMYQDFRRQSYGGGGKSLFTFEAQIHKHFLNKMAVHCT